MDKDRKIALLALARICEKWMLIYLGAGIGFTVSDIILYSSSGVIAGFSVAGILSFALSLINKHVKDYCLKKTGCDTQEGNKKTIEELEK